MKVNTKLDLFDYVIMVEDIVEEFFDENNNYCPHIGELNAMRLFYNRCVAESNFDEKYGHDVVDAKDMAEIVDDKEFIREFNLAIGIGADYGTISCDFGSAYRNALDIVEKKTSSIGNATDTLSLILKKISDSISSAFNEDVTNTISQIGKDMLDGKVTADAIVDAYKKNVALDSEKAKTPYNALADK